MSRMQLIRINEASESSSCATCVLKVILTGLMTNSSKLSRFLSFYSTKKISQNKGRFSNELRFCGYCRAFTCSSKRGDWDPKRVISRDFCALFERFSAFSASMSRLSLLHECAQLDIGICEGEANNLSLFCQKIIQNPCVLIRKSQKLSQMRYIQIREENIPALKHNLKVFETISYKLFIYSYKNHKFRGIMVILAHINGRSDPIEIL